MKVYLPYEEEEEPIVYEIDENDCYRVITSGKETSHVTFVTNRLRRYAISNDRQPDQNGGEECVLGPDGQLGTADDVYGVGNGTKYDIYRSIHI